MILSIINKRETQAYTEKGLHLIIKLLIFANPVMKKNPVIIENLSILDAGSEGKAVGRTENKVVFVPFAVPGDVCDVRIIKKRKNYLEGRIVNIHQYSDKRTDPLCKHFGACGGCKWQNMDYHHQLFFKQKQVEDNLRRIGHLELPEINPILASENKYYYRNKLEFTFSNRKWFVDKSDLDANPNKNGLGFHLPGMFDRILDLDECHLQAEPSDKIRLAARDYALKKELTFYDVKTWEGFLRNLVIRNSSTGDLMVILVVNKNRQEDILDFLEYLKTSFPEITSLHYVINTKRNPDLSDLDIIHFAGEPYITEDLDDLKFRIGPKSFFQTNSTQALQLYRKALDFAKLSGTEVVYDLYCGTGTISSFVARNAKIVHGIEYVKDAVEDARKNSRLNKINNTRFYSGDIAKNLNPDFVRKTGKPDVIITDPPRAGMVEKVIRQILDIEPGRIVYISCNPATQARDLAILAEKYKITGVQPVDMFPHTQHVENVVGLEKR